MIRKFIAYFAYFFYVVRHKIFVAFECLKMGMVIHAFTHDLSKFQPSEFIPYAKYFYLDREKNRASFELAFLLHQHRNKHHWNYWIDSTCTAYPMPKRYVKQMIADWKATEKIKGNKSSLSYWLKLYGGEIDRKGAIKFNLHPDTEKIIESILKVS